MDSTPKPGSSPILIQKLTVSYDEREDRLLLAAQCEDGGAQGLWLTQRLTRPLVKVLLKRLDESIPPGTDRMAEDRRLAMQAWEQSAAAIRQAHPDPVTVSREDAHGLIDTVNVVCLANGDFQLVFHWPEGNALSFPVSATAMRQWLGILRQQYRRADWPAAGVWPAWFDAAQDTGRSSMVVH
jgi:hypothetical protein